MLIDWFTVAAQVVNFLILAWLLKRFLYGPIVAAMDERRRRLAEELQRADEARDEAERRAADLSQRRQALEEAAGTMLAKAQEEAETRREAWLTKARAEVEERSRAWLEAVRREQGAIAAVIRRRVAEQVVGIAAKVLRDLADDDLETRAVEDFLARLDQSEPQPGVRGTISVRTGFALSPQTVQRVEAAIRAHYLDCDRVETASDPELGFGVAVLGGDTLWQWNLTAYLDEAEKAIAAELAAAGTETP